MQSVSKVCALPTHWVWLCHHLHYFSPSHKRLYNYNCNTCITYLPTFFTNLQTVSPVCKFIVIVSYLAIDGVTLTKQHFTSYKYIRCKGWVPILNILLKHSANSGLYITSKALENTCVVCGALPVAQFQHLNHHRFIVAKVVLRWNITHSV